MKFKKGDRVEYIGSNDSGFTRGTIYTVREDELNKYGHLTIELDDNGSNTNGHCSEYFKLIEENKMRTDKKVMAQICRKMAENIENDLDINENVECSKENNIWMPKYHNGFRVNYQYRLKPETITLKNGVVIPKPLNKNEINGANNYFLVSDREVMFIEVDIFFIDLYDPKYIYTTKEEAIEASKALLGIE